MIKLVFGRIYKCALFKREKGIYILAVDKYQAKRVKLVFGGIYKKNKNLLAVV